jgi:hypothetical protein
VKVAAYSDEFDTIAVLGYPAEAVDLVAPGRRRRTIGMRLIVATARVLLLLHMGVVVVSPFRRRSTVVFLNDEDSRGDGIDPQETIHAYYMWMRRQSSVWCSV